ncbi:MAG: pyrophosphatase [Alphaproteobacteria bacterium]|jgi:NAD+ diphosphatase|nr:pyrophosphatase [Alphaproteobacteria bacterium]
MSRPNFYAATGIDRATLKREDEAFIQDLISDSRTRFVPVLQERNLIQSGREPKAVFVSGMMARALTGSGAELIFLGIVEEQAHFAIDVGGLDLPLEQMGEFVDLRQVGPLLFHRDGSLLAYARGMTYWHRRHKFCGVCGTPTKVVKAGHERQCTNPECKAQHFPRTDPAVIMLVTHGDQALLGRGRHFPAGMHSTLAGFVEPGESLEDAVAREVFEEVAVRVKDVRYHSSQPWPFPASIMLGYRAEAQSTEYEVNPDELESARWFTRAELKDAQASRGTTGFFLPRKDSIARRLIEDWLDQD